MIQAPNPVMVSSPRLPLLAATLLVLASAIPASAAGILIPKDRSLPALAIEYQRVNVTIKDQVAITKVEQSFRNDTSTDLEAEYLFPLPEGAAVDQFSMWINGKKLTGEVLPAEKARDIYVSTVRRLKDPGLLEHLDDNLWHVLVYPVPKNASQKIEIQYSQVVPMEGGIAQYIYPLKSSSVSHTEKDFTFRAVIESTAAIASIYSPSHSLEIKKDGEHKATVGFEAKDYALNRDLEFFWTVSQKEVGLSLLASRSDPKEEGYFMLLLAPTAQLPTDQRVPRDVVFVFDTSGSMEGPKFDQAKAALAYCLRKLTKGDRFAVLSFASTVEPFERKLADVSDESIEKALKFAETWEAAGGTAIDEALVAAMGFREEGSRQFNVIFLTDGMPTIGETNPESILRNIEKKNVEGDRFFVFGVGDDVNTVLLDELANSNRGTSLYVRPSENIEVKVSSFYEKISHPVLANLELSSSTKDIELRQMYPPHIPDLFFGSQLVVMGRYTGSGPTALTLTGQVGSDTKKFTYEVKLPAEDKANEFLPTLWARRKVGYLLDQIRRSGESTELVDEVTRLGQKFNIATPYTSYLVMPDEMPQVASAAPEQRQYSPARTKVMRRSTTAGNSIDLQEESMGLDSEITSVDKMSNGRAAGNPGLDSLKKGVTGSSSSTNRPLSAPGLPSKMDLSYDTGKEAVDTAEKLRGLKDGDRVSSASAVKKFGSQTFLLWNGVWVDKDYDAKAPQQTIQAMGDAYFRILELYPQAKEVFALGDRIVWTLPSGTTLIVDGTGADKLDDDAIKALFAPKAKEKP